MDVPTGIQEYFESQNLEILLYPDNTTRSFKYFDEFYKFIENEVSFWNEANSGRTAEIYNYFNGILGLLKAGLRNDNNSIENLNNAITRPGINKFPIIYSATSFGQFLMGLSKISTDQASAAIDYLRNDVNYSKINHDYIKGLMSTFYWDKADEIGANYETSQADSISKLRQQQINLISESNSELQLIKHEFNSFTTEMGTWKTEYHNNIDNLISERKNALSTLEKTYEEKLRLQGPAQYWEELRSDYEKKGKEWRNWSVGTSIILIALLTFVLYKIPTSLTADPNHFTFNDLRGTIILAVLISVGVYMLRIFIKLSISAYHLSRDAKERYQLTHVYLALMNQKDISEAERTIVLQALFSRADTGLLKGDSSPTIPDGTMQQIMKLVSK